MVCMSAIFGENFPRVNRENLPRDRIGAWAYCPDMSPDTLKDALRAYMARTGHSMAQVSTLAGMSESAVKKVLRAPDGWPNLPNAVKLCRLLGLTLDELVHGPTGAGVMAQRFEALSDADQQAILTMMDRLERRPEPLALPAPSSGQERQA